MRSRFQRCLAPTLALLLFSLAHGQCPEWTNTFAWPAGGTNPTIDAELPFDFGDGPVLVLAGSIAQTSSGPVKRAATWDGTRFQPLGSVAAGEVYALASFDHGGGPELYAGGRQLTSTTTYVCLLKWSGTNWVPDGGLTGVVNALLAFDDGSGMRLFAGGQLTIGGIVTDVAAFDGTTWQPLGTWSGQTVTSLAVHDDGSGARLCAGGSFTDAAGVPASYVARWNGSSWEALGSGVPIAVGSLATFDDGSGAELYAALLDGLVAEVYRWNGSAWSQAGLQFDGRINSLAVLDDGTGPRLFAAGRFHACGGTPANAVAFWNGSAWSGFSASAASFYAEAYALAVHDAGTGPALYVGGAFDDLDGAKVSSLARRDATQWSPVGGGASPDAPTRALLHASLGGISRLYAGGSFHNAGTVPAEAIAAWDGAHWSALGGGISGTSGSTGGVWALAMHDDGTGPRLYAGGNFTHAGNVTATNIARWNGSTWARVGLGLQSTVTALATFDDGSGTNLYAAGTAILNGVVCVARWDGTTWTQVGGTFEFPEGFPPSLYALEAFDNGSGSKLYVGGRFSQVGGVTMYSCARWNGTAWTDLGAGLSGDATVRGFEVFDGGTGPRLYACGTAMILGHLDSVAVLTGTHWGALPAGAASGNKFAIHAMDTGSGPALYLGGGTALVGALDRFDGSTWTNIAASVSDSAVGMVLALASFDDGKGHGPDLIAGCGNGNFHAPFPGNMAQYRVCAGALEPFCFGDGAAAACPCQNQGLPGHGCQNSQSTGGAILAGAGTTSPDTVVLTATGLLPTTLTTLIQGSADLWPGVAFGDGLRCTGGTLKRLFTRNAAGGTVSLPGAGDPSISARSAALGFPIAPGTTLVYQAHYRDPSATFCPAPAGNTWNISSGIVIRW